MQIIKKEIPSSDGIHTLEENIYLPSCEPIGFVQAVHGMAEHIGRYDSFMRFMAENGYICFAHDHLGHGKSVNDDKELGYFADKNGYDLLLKDIKSAADTVISEYSEKYGKTLPYCLMGHSMGSFLVRLAAEKYVHPDKLIIMGTSGKNPLATPGIALTAVIKAFYGSRHISPLVNKIAFGGSDKRFLEKGQKDDGLLWLSTDEKERSMYEEDRYCGFDFTVSAVNDLIKMIKYSNRRQWFENIAKRSKILIVSGSEDPIGNFGKGVKQVYDRLKAENADVKMILYENARHEIMHDFCRGKVFDDIKDFLNA